MGSNSTKSSNALGTFYAAYCGKAGGDETMADTYEIHGAADTLDYANSVMSSAKQQLIRDIAEDIAEKLGVPNLKPRNKPLEEVIREMKQYVPDPREKGGNRMTWTSDDAKQHATCQKLARIINTRMKSEVINPDDKSEKICEEVMNVMYSLMEGMSGEFVAVRGDVERILKNLHVLFNILERSYKNLEGKIAIEQSANPDSTIATNTAVMRGMHKDVMEEVNRQMKMLQGMLDVVINPADLELQKVLKDNHEFKHLVKKIKQFPGTGKFGEKLAYTISGVRSIAEAAKVVNDALKKVGISFAEYKKAESSKDLQHLLSNIGAKELDLNEKDILVYNKAKKILQKHQYQHDEIVRELEHEARDAESAHAVAGRGEGETHGGNTDTSGGAPKLDKRVRMRAEAKKALLSAFAKKLNEIFDTVLTSAKLIGEGVSSGRIPLSDKLEEFPRALEVLPDIQQSNSYYALSGFLNDSHSKEVRERYLAAARHLVRVLDDIVADSTYSSDGHFKDLRRGFTEMIELIEKYSARFAEGFGPLSFGSKTTGQGDDTSTIENIGSTVSSVGKSLSSTISSVGDAASSTIKSVKDTINKIKSASTGANEDNIDDCGIGASEDSSKDEVDNYMHAEGASDTKGAADFTTPEITKISYQLDTLKETILYYFRTARIRVNLTKESQELDSYSEGYNKKVADAIAGAVDNVIREKRIFNEDATSTTSSSMGQSLNSAYNAVYSTDTKAKNRLQSLVEVANKMYDTKISMYRVAENVDLYMKAFTQGITSHPDELRSILKILNSTEVISKWFTEKSGDMLCSVFETFPGSFYERDARYSRLNDSKNNTAFEGTHYYVRVSAICRLGNFNTIMDQVPSLQSAPATTDWTTWYATGKTGGDKITNATVADAPSLPGNPYLAIPTVADNDASIAKAIESTKKALSISMLKNIVSLFCTVGAHFGGQDLFKKSNMSAIVMYKALMDYITYSAFSIGLNSNMQPYQTIGIDGIADGLPRNMVGLVARATASMALTAAQTTSIATPARTINYELRHAALAQFVPGAAPGVPNPIIGLITAHAAPPNDHYIEFTTPVIAQINNMLNSITYDPYVVLAIALAWTDAFRYIVLASILTFYVDTIANLLNNAASIAAMGPGPIGGPTQARMGVVNDFVINLAVEITEAARVNAIYAPIQDLVTTAAVAVAAAAAHAPTLDESVNVYRLILHTNNAIMQYFDTATKNLEAARPTLNAAYADFINAALAATNSALAVIHAAVCAQDSATVKNFPMIVLNTINVLTKQASIVIKAAKAAGAARANPTNATALGHLNTADTAIDAFISILNTLSMYGRTDRPTGLPTHAIKSSYSLSSNALIIGTQASNATTMLNPNDGVIINKTYGAMRGVGVFQKATRTLTSTEPVKYDTDKGASPFNDIYEDTDKLFVLTIKSMVAKVLTSIGVYNMFHHPMDVNGLGYFTGLRLTLGGADAIPKVIPEAMELYIRMPLLAEFYRKIFNFNEMSNDGFRMISLVPEMEGTFSGFISVIFDRARFVESGNYSETDVISIIEEINKIWLRFKESKNPVSDIIHEFIAEVNRRYGIFKREERERYQNTIKERYNDQYRTPEELTDYELNTIDETDVFSRPSASESYQLESSASVGATGHKYKLDIDTDKGYIKAMRDEMDKLFNSAKTQVSEKFDDLKRISLTQTIQSRQKELAHAKTDHEKFVIVHTAINSLGQFSLPALEKSMIAFHEMVVAPLGVLQGMYQMINAFFTQIDNVYCALQAFRHWSNQTNKLIHKPALTSTLPGGAITPPNQILLNSTDYWNFVKDYLPATAVAAGVLNGAIAAGAPAAVVAWEKAKCVVKGSQGLEVAAPNKALSLGAINYILNQDFTAMSKEDQQKYADMAYRFVPNQEKILLTTIECLYGHAATFDKLVDMRFEAIHNADNNTCNVLIQLDHSKLRQTILNVFTSVKQTLNKFRGLLPEKIIKKYESYNIPDAIGANIGSLYWLEKHFIDELLDGKRAESLHKESYIKNSSMDNLDRCAEKIKHIFEYLTQPWNINAGGLYVLIPAIAGVWPVAGAPNRPQIRSPMKALTNRGTLGNDITVSMHEFCFTMYNLISIPPLWTANIIAGIGGPLSTMLTAYRLGAVGAPAPKMLGLDDLHYNRDNKRKGAIDPGRRWDNIDRRLNLYDPSQGLKAALITHTSAFLMFNKLIAMYLCQVYDSTSDKIYISTINNFVMGAFNRAILQNENFNDSRLELTNDILDQTKANHHYRGVLFQSLAIDLRQLATEKTVSGDKKKFLEADISEIPMYYKENLRACMPIFNKIFSYLIKRCNLLKTLARAVNVEQVVDIDAYKANPLHAAAAGAWGVATDRSSVTAISNQANERSMVAILDQIIVGCSSLLQCIRDTMNEITDNPKYFETRQNSIQDYEASTGMMPFMPLSSSAFYLKNMQYLAEYNSTDTINCIGLPWYKLGSEPFKLQYGTRGILNRASSKLDDMPGVSDIIKGHNQSCSPKYAIDEKDLSQMITNTIDIIQYLDDAKRYRSLFMSFLNNMDIALPVAANNPQYGHVGVSLIQNVKLEPYSLQNNITLTDIIQMTESTNQREQKRKIITLMQTDDPCAIKGTRDNMLVYNIIDLNVVPINVHALMRDIPLVNLYNYSWTFDKLICETFGISNLTNIQSDKFLDNADVHNSARELLGHLLISPYQPISNILYEHLFSAIMRGDLGIEGLGRPKYLADEVYNKALFGEIYPGEGYREEGGPAVGHGNLHGKIEVLMNTASAKQMYGTFIRDVIQNIMTRLIGPANSLLDLTGVGGYTIPPKRLERLIDTFVARIIGMSGSSLYQPPLAEVNTAIAVLTTRALPAPLPAAPADNWWLEGANLNANPNMAHFIIGLMAVITGLLVNPSNRMSIIQDMYKTITTYEGMATAQKNRFKARAFNNSTLYHSLNQIWTSLDFAHETTIIDISSYLEPLIDIGARNVLGIAHGNYTARNAAVSLLLSTYITTGAVIGKIENAYSNILTTFENGLYKSIPKNTTDVITLSTVQNANKLYFEDALHYLAKKDNGEGEIRHVDVGPFKHYLGILGKLRFDTKLVRNILWLSNIQRALRLKLRRDLTWFNQKVVSDHAVTAASITELFGNDVMTSNYPAKYTY